MKPNLLPETTPSATGTHPQMCMPAGLYLAVWIPVLFALAYVPTILALTQLTATRIIRQYS